MNMSKSKSYTEVPATLSINELADFFKVLGNTTRIKIIYYLYHSEMCVSELVDRLDITESAVSHQLKILRDCKIIQTRRKGKMLLYSMSDKHIYMTIKQGIKYTANM